MVNPGGADRTGIDVTALTNSNGDLVGYLADNPNARYIKAGTGVHPNGRRNTLPLRGINNFDISVSMRFLIAESKAVEYQAAFFNALNHTQFTPGSLGSVRAVPSRITHNNLIPGSPVLNRPDQVYDSHAREIIWSCDSRSNQRSFLPLPGCLAELRPIRLDPLLHEGRSRCTRSEFDELLPQSSVNQTAGTRPSFFVQPHYAWSRRRRMRLQSLLRNAEYPGNLP